MIKGIIFDCFGVLIGRGFKETYRLAGGDPDKDADFIEETLDKENRGSITPAEFQELVAARIGITTDAFRSAVARAELPNEELLAYIGELHHEYKIAMLSNANRGMPSQLFAADVLAETFDAVIVSAEVGYIKPEPEIYQLTAERLVVKPAECVFVDDQDRYCGPAAELGMQTITYRTFDQLQADLKKILAK